MTLQKNNQPILKVFSFLLALRQPTTTPVNNNFSIVQPNLYTTEVTNHVDNLLAQVSGNNTWMLPVIIVLTILLAITVMVFLWRLRHQRHNESKLSKEASLASMNFTKRKQIEAALHESEERYRLLVEMSPDGIIMHRDNKLIYANEAASRLIGSDSPADLIGMSIESFVHPDYWETTWNRAKRMAAGEKDLYPAEDVYVRLDGTAVPVEVIVAPLTYQGQRVVQVIVRDITERKQAQEKLRGSEQRYRNLVDNMNDLVYRYDLLPQRGFFYVSPSATKITGYTPEDHYADPDLGMKLIHPDDRQILENLTYGNEGEPKPIVLRWLKKDGSVIWTEQRINEVHDSANNLIALEGIARDVTERVQAENALHKSEEKFRGIYEQSPIAIQLYDKDGLLVDANKKTLDIFGIEDKQKIIGYNMWNDPNHTEETKEAIQNGEPVYISARLDFDSVKKSNLFPTNQSGIIYLDLHAIPLMNKGSITGYLVQLVDVTERKKIEAQLLQSQKMEAIGRLAGGIAHDFNNLLVPMIGYVELGMLKLNPDDKLFHNLNQVKKAANRATSLVNQILAFSRKQVLEMKVLNLNETVEDFKKMLKRLIGEHIELQTFLEPNLYSVNADSSQIEQVLLNLAVNARDAMPEGGNLTIETANIYLDNNYVNRYAGAQEPGHYVMLAISDTGSGMEEETKQRIFEPFFTTKERGKGTGLGLSTVFGIVKQHGGNVWVYSEPDKGTTFKIYLPKVDSDNDDSEIAADEYVLSNGTETILVVEDEMMVRQLVCETLSAHGYTVLEAINPSDGIRIATEQKDSIQLLLTDVVMPEMNGRSLFNKIATIDSNIKVLYMSGYTDNVIVHHGILEEGINYLQKPFTIQNLINKVRQILDQGNL